MAAFNNDGTNEDVNMMEAKSEETEQFSSGNTDDSLVKRFKLKTSSTEKETRYNCEAVHEGIKYPCWQCEHEATSKGSLALHKRAVHEGIKYPCGQCQYEATTKDSLTQHRRAVHEGLKYPCEQCQHQVTSKDYLAQHIISVHEGIKYPCGQCQHQATTAGSL